MKKIVRNQRGINLLEVMISMLILAFGILSLAPMMVISINENTDSRDRSIAAQIAKERLESLEAMASFSGLPAQDIEANLREKFTRTTNIVDAAADTTIPDNRYMVIVTVSWQDDDKNELSTSLSTLIRKD